MLINYEQHGGSSCKELTHSLSRTHTPLLLGQNQQSRYEYTQQLQTLASRIPLSPCHLPSELCDVVTPLRADIWSTELTSNPDQLFCQYIIRGLREGFRVGFNYESSQLRAKGCNLISASEHPEVVDDYLAVEKSVGRMGAIPQHLLSAIPLHVSPFGVIPKKAKPGKWRLIIDLSSPVGWSVNDGIEKELCSMSYVSIDQVVDCILNFESGALMAKIDIKQAYRNIPVHPDDRHLLAMQWRNEVLIDKSASIRPTISSTNFLCGGRCPSMDH